MNGKEVVMVLIYVAYLISSKVTFLKTQIMER